jgi:LysR family transcriptional activator of dmlA
MINEPQLSDLRLFAVVAKHASFVKAAHALALAPNTVSKRVAMLEEALGVKLLQRTTRTVKVTDDGLKVYQWAQKILDAVSDMQGELAGHHGELTGPVRVSASSRLGRDYVAPALSKMKRRFPGIEVWLELMDRRVDLLGEAFHMDVRSGNAHEPNVIGHRVAKSVRFLCASPAYLKRQGQPQSLADLAQHQCLLFRDRGEPFGVWKLKGPRGWEEVRVTGDLASNDNEVVMGWAHDGHGIMIGADWFVAQSLAQGKLQRILPDWQQPVDVWAISTQRSNQSAKVRIIIEYLKEEMASMNG